MTEAMKVLDVRPMLRDGGEPFPEIMQAVSDLADGEGLRLLATFRPVPLFAVLGKRGYDHSEREIGDGDWEVTFTPQAGVPAPKADELPGVAPTAPPDRSAANTVGDEPEDDSWPAPVETLDNRGMMPPEPMVRTLERIESLADAEVIEIINDRDPLLLYPELDARGHEARRTESGPDGYHVLIRKGTARGES